MPRNRTRVAIPSWGPLLAVMLLSSTPSRPTRSAPLTDRIAVDPAPSITVAKARRKSKRGAQPEQESAAPPELLSPASDAQIETTVLKPIVFSWQSEDAAALFDIELARDQDFVKIASQRTVAGRSFEMLVQPEEWYWWRVCALDGMGRRDTCSAAKRFLYRVVSAPPPEESQQAAGSAASIEDSSVVEERTSIAPAERLVFHVGPRLSLFYNLGEVATARGALELGYRLPVLTHFVGFALSAGYYTAAAETSDDDGLMSLRSRLHALPMDLIISFLFTTDLVDLYAGAGPSLDIGVNTVQLTGYPEQTHGSVDFGLVGVAGVERMLGPGALFVDARYALTTETTGVVEHNPGGLNVGLGYRVRIW